MKVGIVYDSSDCVSRSVFERVSETAREEFERVDVVDVAAGASAPCIGCFNCWVKTPGVCALPRDEGTGFAEKFWDSRYVVIVSRIQWGGYATGIKLFLDRIIPILHPYFQKVCGEMHHRFRYDAFPEFLAVGHGARSSGERETFRGYVSATRTQGGFRSTSGGSFVIEGSELSNESLDACGAWFLEEAKK